MKKAKFILWILCALLLSPAAVAQRNNSKRIWNKKTFINALNDAAEGFRTLTADLEITKVTVVVDHSETESGRLYVRKNSRIKIEMLEPEPKEILFSGRKAEIYYPNMKQIQEFNLSKHRDMLEQFLLLGFGTRGDDLDDAYLIQVHGETRLDNRPALEVELTPRDDKIRSNIHEIRIWFDMASWIPLQQKFFEFGGDNTTTRYTNVKVNVPIPRRKLRLTAPSGTTRIKPQNGF